MENARWKHFEIWKRHWGLNISTILSNSTFRFSFYFFRSFFFLSHSDRYSIKFLFGAVRCLVKHVYLDLQNVLCRCKKKLFEPIDFCLVALMMMERWKWENLYIVSEASVEHERKKDEVETKMARNKKKWKKTSPSEDLWHQYLIFILKCYWMELLGSANIIDTIQSLNCSYFSFCYTYSLKAIGFRRLIIYNGVNSWVLRVRLCVGA